MLTACFQGSTAPIQEQYFYSLAAQSDSSHTHASQGRVYRPFLDSFFCFLPPPPPFLFFHFVSYNAFGKPKVFQI